MKLPAPLAVAALALAAATAPDHLGAQPLTLTIDAAAPGRAISPDLMGIFFEDLNYAADALALGSSATFLSYVEWITAFLERRQVPRSMLIESLETLREAPDARTELRALLAEAVTKLTS